MRVRLQHYLNACHIYCYLRNVGVSRVTALTVAKRYEAAIHAILYPSR
jgi:hypothetical protein